MNILALFAVAASFAFDVAPWKDTALGTEDTVPPPWTLPVAAKAQYSCWGRTYSFGGGGLVSSVKSQAKELLADPVTVEVNGSNVSFKVECVSRGVSFADYDFVAENFSAGICF